MGRDHVSAVPLPDGRIVLVCGWDGNSPPTNSQLRRAEYVTVTPPPQPGQPPQLAVASGTGMMGAFRGYHSVVLLLPDGRVLVGGGRDMDPGSLPAERADYTILSPSYIDDSVTRPQITFVGEKVLTRQSHPSPPSSITETSITVDMPTTAPPAEAVVISLGSMTHSYDFNQRSVQVALSSVIPSPSDPTVFTALVTAPGYAWAPPGYYMLFVLDQNRIPSPAAMVRLQ